MFFCRRWYIEGSKNCALLGIANGEFSESRRHIHIQNLGETPPRPPAPSPNDTGVTTRPNHNYVTSMASQMCTNSFVGEKRCLLDYCTYVISTSFRPLRMRWSRFYNMDQQHCLQLTEIKEHLDLPWDLSWDRVNTVRNRKTYYIAHNESQSNT